MTSQGCDVTKPLVGTWVVWAAAGGAQASSPLLVVLGEGERAEPAAPGGCAHSAGQGGCVPQESNGPTDAYAAIAKADRLTQEPESLRKWREEQKQRLQELGEHGEGARAGCGSQPAPPPPPGAEPPAPP